jgi:hypothetical protein
VGTIIAILVEIITPMLAFQHHLAKKSIGMNNLFTWLFSRQKMHQQYAYSSDCYQHA